MDSKKQCPYLATKCPAQCPLKDPQADKCPVLKGMKEKCPYYTESKTPGKECPARKCPKLKESFEK
jgi:hypothetical protein